MISRLLKRFILYFVIMIIFIMNVVLAISVLCMLIGYIFLKNSEKTETFQLIKYCLIICLPVAITISFIYSNDTINAILYFLIGAFCAIIIFRLNSIFINLYIYKQKNVWYENYLLATIYLMVNLNLLLLNDLASGQRPIFPKL